MTDKEKFDKIVEMHFSDNPEDQGIAKGWLTEIVGATNVEANLFVLEFYREDNDSGFKIDADNYATATYRTFSICYGKNYMYAVDFKASYKGDDWLDQYNEYSRYAIADERAYDDLKTYVYKYFRRQGINLNHELMVSAHNYAALLQE